MISTLENDMKKIVCYGDSNTFGYIPGKGGRYDCRTRWPGKLQDLLGASYEVIEEGLCGRTTAFKDMTCSGRCGLDTVGEAVRVHQPVDLFVVMLGSNDCKAQFHASAVQIKSALEKIVKEAASHAAKSFQTLLIAPAPITENVLKSGFGTEFDETSLKVSRELAAEYKKLAEALGCGFLDASEAVCASVTDGLHLDKNGHLMLACAVEKRIKEMQL